MEKLDIERLYNDLLSTEEHPHWIVYLVIESVFGYFDYVGFVQLDRCHDDRLILKDSQTWDTVIIGNTIHDDQLGIDWNVMKTDAEVQSTKTVIKEWRNFVIPVSPELWESAEGMRVLTNRS